MSAGQLQFWAAVDPTEGPVLTMDFADQVAKQGGGPITGASIVVTPLYGTDADPQAIVQGSCDVTASPKVRWRKAPGAGVADAYLVTITVTLAGPYGPLVGQMGLPIRIGGAL